MLSFLFKKEVMDLRPQDKKKIVHKLMALLCNKWVSQFLKLALCIIFYS